jgi:hypothetical protein
VEQDIEHLRFDVLELIVASQLEGLGVEYTAGELEPGHARRS